MNTAIYTITGFTQWLSAHTHLAYLILFLGSYFETLVGPAFFLPGEIFFLSGSLLAGAHVLNIFLVATVFYSGGILGDSSSYFIGRKLGRKVFKEGRRIFSLKNYEAGSRFFEKHGRKSIFLARLLGPLSWITPFLAGTYGITYPTFLMYNVPGVMVGIGEFLVVGYFFGYKYVEILSLIQHYTIYAILAIVLVIIGVIYFKKWRRSKDKVDVLS